PLPFGKVKFIQPQRVGSFIARRLALLLHLSLHESAGLKVERHRPNSELKAVDPTPFRWIASTIIWYGVTPLELSRLFPPCGANPDPETAWSGIPPHPPSWREPTWECPHAQ